MAQDREHPSSLRERIPQKTRMILQITSGILCFFLVLTLLLTVLSADVQRLISPESLSLAIEDIYSVKLSEDTTLPDATSGSLYTPDLSDPESVVNWTYDVLHRALGEGPGMTRENVCKFIKTSSFLDFMAERASNVAKKLLKGKDTKVFITHEEMMELIEDNDRLIEKRFGITLDSEKLRTVSDNVTLLIEHDGLNTSLQKSMKKILNSTEDILPDKNLQESLELVGPICSEETLTLMILLCILLAAGLVGLNFYNLPAGLTYVAIPCACLGLLLSLPLWLMDSLLTLFPRKIRGIFERYLSQLGAVHYTVLAIGIAVLAASIAWRLVRKHMKK